MGCLIFKGDNNRVMFLSSSHYRSQLSIKYFFCGKEKLNPFLFSFPKLFMLLCICWIWGGRRGDRREWHMSAADALGTESKGESYRLMQHLAGTREEERTTETPPPSATLLWSASSLPGAPWERGGWNLCLGGWTWTDQVEPWTNWTITWRRVLSTRRDCVTHRSARRLSLQSRRKDCEQVAFILGEMREK